MRARPSADSATDAARAGRRARRGGARVREVVVDLPAHALDLLRDRRGELGLAGGRGALGLLRQHRERRLQAVREIAGLADRAADRCVAMLEQRVEIVDERLHFARIASLRACASPLLHVGQPLAHLVERRQPARGRRRSRPPCDGDGQHRHDRCACECTTTSGCHARRSRRQHDRPDREQADRPEHRADAAARAAERLSSIRPRIHAVAEARAPFR